MTWICNVKNTIYCISHTCNFRRSLVFRLCSSVCLSSNLKILFFPIFTWRWVFSTLIYSRTGYAIPTMPAKCDIPPAVTLRHGMHASQTGSRINDVTDGGDGVRHRSTRLSAAHRRNAVHVHRDRHHDLSTSGSGHAHFRLATGTARRRTVVVRGRLDALPLGASVLEPDLDLDLGEAKLERDLWALGQRQVLLDVELAFQLRQLTHKTHTRIHFTPRVHDDFSRIARTIQQYLLIGEIALLTRTVKRTIIFVKCCADPFRLFGCIFIAFV